MIRRKMEEWRERGKEEGKERRINKSLKQMTFIYVDILP